MPARYTRYALFFIAFLLLTTAPIVALEVSMYRKTMQYRSEGQDLKQRHARLVEKAEEEFPGWSCIGRRFVPGRDTGTTTETLAVVCTPSGGSGRILGWDDASQAPQPLPRSTSRLDAPSEAEATPASGG